MASPVILPEKYYLDYFNYVLDFVEEKYTHILDEPEYLFYQAFRNLSEDAQCLYLRFSNRKGHFFRIGKIQYQEISDISAAKEELLHQGFIRINESEDPIQFRLFTKAELVHHFDFLEEKARKDELLIELTEMDLSIIYAEEEIAETLKVQEVEFIKLLFFGNRYAQMTEFVIRDVGNIKVEALDESKFRPWCSSREEAMAVMHLSELKTVFRALMAESMSIHEVLEEVPWQNLLQYPATQKSGGKLIIDIGKYLEQSTEYESALNIYQHTSAHPARERSIRLLEKLERKEEAIRLAQVALDSPVNATERIFANDFLKRTGKRINRSMTERLKQALSIELEKDANIRVETAVLLHFRAQGWEGFHCENVIWRALFGLIFWEEIFDQEAGTFHHPLQRGPSDMRSPDFLLSRSEKMHARLTTITSKRKLLSHLKKTYRAKDGTANQLITWHDSLLQALQAVVERVPLKSIKRVLIEMPKNLRDNSSGFPDLFLWQGKDYVFYEIKSPNDHLSAQQLFWLDFMTEAGIKAEVLKVDYV